MPRRSRQRKRAIRHRRDYKAEYRRRIARALAKGLSRSQGRGHPKSGERHATTKQFAALQDARIQTLLRSLRQGKGIGESARSAGLSTERARHVLTLTGAARKPGRRWEVRDDLPRRMPLYTDGREIPVTVANRRTAAAVSFFMSSVKTFLVTNDADYLAIFVGNGVTDINGKLHPFETNPDNLYRLAASGADPFEQVYRIVI